MAKRLTDPFCLQLASALDELDAGLRVAPVRSERADILKLVGGLAVAMH